MDATARANLYGFFARLFVRELDDEAIAMVTGPLGLALLEQFAGSAEVSALQDEDTRQAVFDADFAHITIVNVVPYASFYESETAVVEASATTQQFLKEIGLEVDLAAARSVSPDHAGIQLEVMAKLCAAEAEAIARPDPAYADKIRKIGQQFLQDHVVGWLPLYLFAVERCAHTRLYGEAARVAMDFVASDLQWLSMPAAQS
ncbi:MAG: molecular chaperone TorD family protein [Myxococcales bacterium]|nr:molecular chaperone TorD family protein [Myxococcales bacterium]